jgi:hypothetical protein
LRASKDGCKHSAEQHPSRRAEDGAHLRMTVRLLQDDGGGGSFHQSKPPNRCTSAFSRHTAPEFFKIHSPQKKRAQGRPGARCTRGLMCKDALGKSAHEHTGSAEAVRPSLRNGFTAYSVLSPARPGLLVTVTPKKRELPRNLTPATGASGPHDFAVRVSRARQSQPSRPSLPAPTSVTMANAPSLGTGWRGISR